ncbi:type II toxin-antitoxin system VapB family antitoxin [Nocardiopsis sp. RSe5-2]|uniref:Type II toxin-antitoxin system VapB family antitoxin n=1 Tax=Nocardiopsis endophytica TaxID=3018445 RepID=A0ABT4TZR2_9ACTN|nr:type II toxin-antitoxin system VapB family antitoxin [Nocardiopsis endophytica]MDA2809592.1 type II toxin-antitoxin system VapB family antitoxin [Nocardiopsis endophytica]
MTVTRIDIAPDVLSDVMRMTGAATETDAVNLALRDYVARHSRIAALEHFAALSASWDYEFWKRCHENERAPTE